MFVLVLIISFIAGTLFFSPPLASLFLSVPINEEFLKIAKESGDRELIEAFEKAKKSNYINALIGAAVTTLALILGFGSLKRYLAAIIIGYFGIPLIFYSSSIGQFRESTVQTAIQILKESRLGREERAGIFKCAEWEIQTQHIHDDNMALHIKNIAMIEDALLNYPFLFDNEEKAQLESVLSQYKNRQTEPCEEPENDCKEKTKPIIL